MKLLFALFLLPLQLFAQDITGVWTGTLYSDSTRFIKYELAISEYNGKLSGYSHTIFVIDSVQNVGIKSIKIKKAGKEFFLEDDKLVYNNYTGPAAKGVKQYSKLFLSENDTALVLAGPWKTNQTKEYQGLTGKVFLQRKKKITESLIMAGLEDLGLARSLSFMTSTDQPNDLAILYHTGFNAASPNPADLGTQNFANGVGSNNPGIQQHSQPGKQISGEAVNTKTIAKEKPEIKSVLLPAPNRAAQNDNSPDVPAARGLASKPGTDLIAGQQEMQRSNTGMRREDSAVNTGITKAAPPLMAKTATTKNAFPAGVSIRSGTPRTRLQPEADIKMPDKVVKKENGVVKDIKKADASMIAKVPPTTIERIPGASISPEPGHISKSSETNNKVPGEIIKKENAVNKDPRAGLSVTTAKPTPKVEPAHMVSLKQVPQINTQQKEMKETPGPALLKSSENINPALVSRAAAEIATREIETIRSVHIKSDSLLLTLYDNGEIDGDTVSVLLNGKVIMPMQGLTSKAINKTIYLTPEMGDSVVLIMYAENLGSIAPNTGLLVIHDEGDIYEIRFTGDLKKNSSIILKRKRMN